MGIYRLFSANFRSPWAAYRPLAAPNSVELLRGAVCIFSVVLRSPEWRISFLPSRSDNEVIADLCQDVSPISNSLP